MYRPVVRRSRLTPAQSLTVNQGTNCRRNSGNCCSLKVLGFHLHPLHSGANRVACMPRQPTRRLIEADSDPSRPDCRNAALPLTLRAWLEHKPSIPLRFFGNHR